MKFAQTNSNIELPENFLDGAQALSPRDKEQLLEALEQAAPVSVRLNPDKNTHNIFDEHRSDVDWCSSGLYLDHRPQFTLDPRHHGGAYYVQEAGSMFIEQLFKQGACKHEQPKIILDLCASPGGKSTLLSSLADEGALVVANEVIRARTAVLAENVRRWGKGNTIVTSNDAAHFIGLSSFFDLIVVDAPCSGEGMFRKDKKARGEWSLQAVETCAARQKRILSDIWPALKVGGTLIYSTCTFNNRENEDNVQWLCNNFSCSPLEVPIPESWGVEKTKVSGIDTFRFMPHKTQSEGFFAAILRKEGGSVSLNSKANEYIEEPTRNNRDKKQKKKGGKGPQTGVKNIFSPVSVAEKAELEKWVNSPENMCFAKIADTCYAFEKSTFEDVKLVAQSLSATYSGVAMGRFFGSDFKPEHSLALYHGLNREAVPNIELSYEQAIEYLRKHDIDAELFEQGLNLLCYQGTPIGWLKRSGTRTTNMLPKELRIMNL
ncbi:MAG: rRNA cytosine-C5-methylase [Rikenellaceae bacterium]